jgi:hypothetical protein
LELLKIDLKSFKITRAGLMIIVLANTKWSVLINWKSILLSETFKSAFVGAEAVATITNLTES